jgi:hypothetical protein
MGTLRSGFNLSRPMYYFLRLKKIAIAALYTAYRRGL